MLVVQYSCMVLFWVRDNGIFSNEKRLYYDIYKKGSLTLAGCEGDIIGELCLGF